MNTGLSVALDPTLRSHHVEDFEKALRRRIVGQDDAVNAAIELYQTFRAGLHPPGRPIGNLLFLGPTGSGKTRVVESIAEVLFGDVRALIKIDCGEFQHGHEIAKLIGSPPGYLGHHETHPVMTQEALDQFHTDQLQLTFLLFDEIEKASDTLWQLLLGILDKATLTLGDNRRVDLSRCVIVLTSNLGAAEMSELLNGGLGFTNRDMLQGLRNTRLNEQLARTALEAARRKFSPEFMNRIDKTVVFKTLDSEQLQQILDIELLSLQGRILQTSNPSRFTFSCTTPVKTFLLQEGTDRRYGARHLKRAIEKYLVFPLANLVATGQIKSGDFVRIDRDCNQMTFCL
jgi:ATP-dependent Clp protease ATP-binding subunit ClpB